MILFARFGRPSSELTIFTASALGLFLELALIRWVSSEIRVFAYCKNLALVASFLGFGAGCFLARRRVDAARTLLLLLLLVLVIVLPWPMLQDFGPRRVTVVLTQLPGFMIFRHAEVDLSWGLLGQLAFAVGWTTVLFFAIAGVMVPFGQLTAAGMARLGRPLTGYSLNVAGSLLGILSFTAATRLSMPPLAWFAPVGLGLAVLAAPRRAAGLGLGFSLALSLALLPTDSRVTEIWSPYQKLQLFPGGAILVNNTGYQNMRSMPELPPQGPITVDRWGMAYALRRPAGRVLIVGAGSGNDAAAALRADASSVTAVEIDRVIYRIGAALHPDRPYGDRRVGVVIDDARHFLRTTREAFDVITFSHLDSHTLLSSFTNVRLDDYIHTTEAFREARARLAPGGLMHVAFWVERPFLGERLHRNLTLAFGHEPVALETDVDDSRPDKAWRTMSFLTGEPEMVAKAEAAWSGWPGVRRVSYKSDVTPSTDSWPFLSLDAPRVPPLMLLVSGIILALAGAFALWARPRGEAFDPRLFWMGAAFMLVEVHNVSRLALVFGTTWHVNAWVIGAILLVILLANGAYAWLRERGRRPKGWAAAGLFASLGAAWAVPLESLLAFAGPLGGPAATLLMTLPLFFAGLVFAEAFADSPTPGFALGWNVLGSVVGGMTENVSYVFGIPALVPVAAIFYALALFLPRHHAHARAPAARVA